jgi:thiol-disulfide isomerase/thioredoxin
MLLAACVAAGLPLSLWAQDSAAFEQRVADATQSAEVTVVHFWAPWCSNCKSELGSGGWTGIIAANPDVHFIFVTIWNPEDGHEVLARYGVGAEKNFELMRHPNGSRKMGEKVTGMLGMPISWIPTTWVFRDGKLLYAMNYGELRFPVLQQFIRDSSDSWDH